MAQPAVAGSLKLIIIQKKTNMKHFRIFSLLTFAIMGLFACQSSNNGAPTDEVKPQNDLSVALTEEQFKTGGIVIDSIRKRTFNEKVQVSGQVMAPPQNLLSVSCPLGGFVSSTSLMPGSAVKKGQVLALMQDQQFIQLQEDYLSSQSRHGFLKLEAERQKALNANKASSDKELQLTMCALKEEEIKMAALNEKLSLLGIQTASLSPQNLSSTIALRSPVSGFVASMNVNIGKYVQPTDVMFQLIDPNDLHLVLTVFESDAQRLQIGQKVSAFTNLMPDDEYEGEIILLGQQLNADRAIEVQCHFLRYAPHLIPGTFMNARIDLSAAEGLAVPADAVVKWNNESFVFIPQNNGVFHMVKVRELGEQDGWIRLAEVPSAVVVTRGAYALLMELKNAE
jgi:membrane fusion protein, heavy metal efflux system